MAVIGIVGGKEKDIDSLFTKMLASKNKATLYKLDEEDTINIVANNEIEKIELLIVQEPRKLTERICKIVDKDCLVLINSDRFWGVPVRGAQVITYGFNSRASVTASSVNDNSLQVCVQRKFYSLGNRAYEPQEFSAPFVYSCDPTMALGAAAAAMVCDLLPPSP